MFPKGLHGFLPNSILNPTYRNRSHDDDELLHLARVTPDLEELQIGERK